MCVCVWSDVCVCVSYVVCCVLVWCCVHCKIVSIGVIVVGDCLCVSLGYIVVVLVVRVLVWRAGSDNYNWGVVNDTLWCLLMLRWR